MYLKKNKDAEGVKLWNEIDKKTMEGTAASLPKVERFLQDVPLYYLLAFLGYASYRETMSTFG